MSDSLEVEADALARAIESNPDAVAAFLERLDLVNELLDVVELGHAAMDDEMAASLTGTAALLAESADGLATPETASLAARVGEDAADLESALATLVALERSGALDDLAELADVASLATAALDDEMVTTLARTGSSLGEVIDTAADPETVRGLDLLLGAVGEATDEPAEPVGLRRLLGDLRDPDVRRGLGFLLAVARATGRGLDRPDGECP